MAAQIGVLDVYKRQVSILFLEVCLEGIQLIAEFLRQLVAKLLIELFDALCLLGPLVVVDFQDALEGVDAEIQSLQIDVLCIRYIADRRLLRCV